MLILCSRLTTSTVYPNHCSAAFYNLVTIMLSRLLFSQIDRILVGSPKVAQSGPVPVCKFPTCGQVCKARTRAWNMNHRGMSLSCPWLRHCAYAPTGGPWLRHRAYAPTCGPWLRHCAYAHAPGALNVRTLGIPNQGFVWCLRREHKITHGTCKERNVLHLSQCLGLAHGLRTVVVGVSAV